VNLETALARKTDLIFGNQTYLRLKAFRRELLLRHEIAPLKRNAPARQTRIVLLSYQPRPDEAGSERAFDLSQDSVQQRWSAGEADMERALDLIETSAAEEVLVVRRHAHRE